MSTGISPVRIAATHNHPFVRPSAATGLDRTRLEIALVLITISTLGLLLGSPSAQALNPSLDISQYAHTAWKIRDGFSPGTAFAMAQTPDGYLWLGTEFGLFRSDGVRFVRWGPPSGQHLPESPYSLLVSRDGTLWIGTFAGLVSWKVGKLTQYPELGTQFVTSLFEDREGTVWAGEYNDQRNPGRLCAIRNGAAQCDGQDGAFGNFIWSLGEDRSGTLWVGTDSGLWRWKPGPPKRYAVPGMRLADLTLSLDGRLIVGIRDAGLRQVVGEELKAYPIRSAIDPNALLPEHDVDANKLLRDRDGGLWIGTNQRGLIHVHQGRTDVFTEADGLSGNIIAGLFEDREGSIWVSTAGGLDRFRELPVTTVSAKQGLSSGKVHSVIAGADGSIWAATRDGLTRMQNGRTTIFRKADGLPDDLVQSLYQDDGGRIWVFTAHGLACFQNGRFVAVRGIPSTEVYSMTGDKAGNLWLSGDTGVSHLLNGRFIEHLPWSVLQHPQKAKAVVPGKGGVWLRFWRPGSVLYIKDGQVRASYTAADGLGKGAIAGIQLGGDGAVWAATQGGGLSRIKDGMIASLTSKNGLSCDTIHWSIEDDDRTIWLYTACGLVRITRPELDAWIADPTRKVQTTVWDAADGVTLRSATPAYFGPPVTKSPDGRLWFITGEESIDVIDPRHLALNKVPPPVHIEKIVADHKTYWLNLPGTAISGVRLPPHTRDLRIDYTALSLVSPEKVHFRYKLEGQDPEWREAINDRQAQYSNLGPGTYRFRVIASNNSGVWNENGDALEFSIAPAYYQTNWFRALCAVLVLTLAWAAWEWRMRQLHHQFELTLDARVSERTRIARDLHDTLLQSFHGILLRLQTVSQLLRERPTEAQEKLDSTIDQVAEAITEGRDAVRGLRESTVQHNDLAQAISALGEELATDSTSQSAAFRVAVEGKARDLHPIVRDEVYRIAAEALRNAFQHAQARQVEVEIRYDDQQLRLRVRDDGKGMNPRIRPRQDNAGHFGLSGMRERATLIGGKLTVWSEANSGTELELSLSGSVAYIRARAGSWLSRKFAGIAKG